MVTLEIEKEIRNESRVLFGFTLRQVISFGMVIGVIAGEVVFLRPGTDVLIASGMGLGALAYYMSFHKKNGLYMDYYLENRVREFMLHNSVRDFRVKNSYVRALNAAYERERKRELSSGRGRRAYKRRERRRLRKRRRSRVYGYR